MGIQKLVQYRVSCDLCDNVVTVTDIEKPLLISVHMPPGWRKQQLRAGIRVPEPIFTVICPRHKEG